jgi:adenine phosphoribosyltransferase
MFRLATARLAAPGAAGAAGSARRGMATLPAPDKLLGATTFGGGLLGGMFLSGLFASSPEEEQQPLPLPENPKNLAKNPKNPKAAEELVVVPPAALSAEDFAPILAKAMAIAAAEAASPPPPPPPAAAASGNVDLEAAWRSAVVGGGAATSATSSDYTSNGPTAQRIAAVTPYFPFKGIPRFYDIGGFLKNPAEFQLAVDAFVARYQGKDIDAIAGFDARGFILGPPIALALKKPFIMLRKKGKMPNAITGAEYSKEYAGNDALSIPRGSVGKGDKVLLIDDLVATGGTLVAGIELVKQMGGVPVEAACVVELKFLDARKKFADNGHSDVPIWALMDEEILTLDGMADPSIPTDGYTDDGEAH